MNELGQETFRVTDQYGNVLQETSNLGQTTTYERNADGQATKITGPAASGGVSFQ